MAEQLPQAVEVTTENQPRKAATAGPQLLPPQMVHSQVQTARTQLQSHFYYTSMKLMLKFSSISISKSFNLKLRSAKPTSSTEEHFLCHSKVALLPQGIQPTDPPDCFCQERRLASRALQVKHMHLNSGQTHASELSFNNL